MLELKIGLICIGLEGERNDLAEKFRAEAVAELAKRNVTVVNARDGYTLTGCEVLGQTEKCVVADADAIVYLIGTWCLASHVVDAIRDLKVPFAIWGVPEPASFSSVGVNVIHGALGEMDIPHKLLYGLPGDARVYEELIAFVKAAALKTKLARVRIGLIGGRAISAYPTSMDPNLIKRIFGAEVEHIDQLVLLEKARKVSAAQCEEKIAQMRGVYRSVEVPGEMLRRAVAVYFALREIIEEQQLDMLSVKCIGEFMDNWACCCIGLSMLNDEGIVCNCQCNINALISAYLLANLSGCPCFFGDVNTVHRDEGTIRLICCGGLPGKLAESFEEVKVVPQYEYMGAGRGACTFFCMKQGRVTVGTLGRDSHGYVMNIAGGTAYLQPDEELLKVRSWAQGFVRLDGDPMQFYQNLRCNHSVVGYGDYSDVLMEFCALCGIRPELCEKEK